MLKDCVFSALPIEDSISKSFDSTPSGDFVTRIGMFVPTCIRDGAFDTESFVIVILSWLGVTACVNGRWMRSREPEAEAAAYPAGGGLAIFRTELRSDAFSSLAVFISINGLKLDCPILDVLDSPSFVLGPCPAVPFAAAVV